MSVSISIDWIPPAKLRGNHSGHWRSKQQDKKAARDLGYALGLEFKHKYPIHQKVINDYSVSITAATPRPIDGDNLMIGYKPLIDGLVHSGVIPDDKHIKHWSITLEKGEPHSRLEFQELI